MGLFPGTVELRGLERLPEGPCVLAPNHQSMVDLLVLYLLPRQYRTVIKRSLFLSPFGLSIWSAGYVPTASRSDPKGSASMLSACRTRLERGYDVLIFPEGTRARGWRLGRFKRGAFELAQSAEVPVVPIAIAGTNDVLHASSLRLCLRPLRIVLEVLEPIAPSAEGARALERACHRVLSTHVDGLRRELREAGQGPAEPSHQPSQGA